MIGPTSGQEQPMPHSPNGLEAADRAGVFVPHAFPETLADLGEVRMNDRARALVEAAGQPFEYRSFPEMPHSMHDADPELYARTVIEWATALPA
jgi:hypothetical protein